MDENNVLTLTEEAAAPEEPARLTEEAARYVGNDDPEDDLDDGGMTNGKRVY